MKKRGRQRRKVEVGEKRKEQSGGAGEKEERKEGLGTGRNGATTEAQTIKRKSQTGRSKYSGVCEGVVQTYFDT